MLQVNKVYRIETLVLSEGGYDTHSFVGKVTRVDENLIEVDGHTILNVQSHLFHAAIDEAARIKHYAEADAALQKELE